MKVLSYMNSLTAALALSISIDGDDVCIDMIDEHRIKLGVYVL